MQRQKHIDDVHRLAGRALSRGAERVSAMRVRWDISNGCPDPYHTEHFARPSRELDVLPDGLYPGEVIFRKKIVVKPGGAFPMCVEILTPCRKCDYCLKRRARLWRTRAEAEVSAAVRTWFCTLTLSPDEHFMALTRARARQTAKGEDFETLPVAEQFIARHNQISGELTKFLKRVRQSGPFRFLLVVEAHKSGLPHYHCLIHEVDPDKPVLHRVLKQNWKLGHASFKLVEDYISEDGRLVKVGGYVAKYLAKSALARVRASIDYGSHNAYSVEPVLKDKVA